MGEDLTFTDGGTRVSVRGDAVLVEDLRGADLTDSVGCTLAMMAVGLGIVLAVVRFAYVIAGSVVAWSVGVVLASLLLIYIASIILEGKRIAATPPLAPLGPGQFRRQGSDLVITPLKHRRAKPKTIPAPAGLAIAISPTGYHGLRFCAILFRMHDDSYRAMARFGIERDRQRRLELERVAAAAASALQLPFHGRIPMPPSERDPIEID